MNALTASAVIHKLSHPKPYEIYLVVVSTAGLVLCALGMQQLLINGTQLNFLLLVALTIAAAFANTSIAVQNSGINYSVGSSVGLAAVPFFGIGPAILTATVLNICTWLIKPSDQTWKKSWTQLAFNIGMYNITMAAGGQVLLLVRAWFPPATLVGQLLPWLLGAYVLEELNFWLLAVILRLQYGSSVNPRQMWREDQWATQIGTLVTAAGGWVLAFAIENYDWVGVAIFFLPILLSAYAFRLYVRQMQSHLDNLEQIVGERTKQLAERTHELAEINEQKDAFLSVLTHDMMTPLANIRFSAEVIREDLSSADSQHLAQLILHSQQSLHSLVRNILDLAKLQAVGTLPIHKAKLELSAAIQAVVMMLEHEAREKRITLEMQVTPARLWLEADAQQLARVLMNLLSNALKYTPVGGSVQVNARQDNDEAVIDVQDTGYGIPADELPYLFERFRRVKQLEDKASGTGLGLAIAKALVEQHGGAIQVTSEVGKGSLFRVRLPLE